MKNKILPAVFVVAFALSRIPGLMPQNFSVAYAFMFCAGVFFPRRLAWWLPLVTMLATDIGLNFYYQQKFPTANVWSAANLANLAFNYAAYLAIIFLGKRFKPQDSILKLAGGGILGAILFYLITNTASWFFNPFHYQEYTKTLAGWLVALTKGANGFPPTTEFFRNTFLSSGIFTTLFAAAEKFTTAESPAEKTAGVHEPQMETQPEEVAS